MNELFRPPKVLACLCTLLATVFGSIAFAQVTPSLPPGTTTPTVSFASDQSLPSFAQVQFADLPPGYDVINQTYPGWCTTFNEALQVLPTGSGSPIWSENDAVHPSMSACMTRTFMRSIPTANRSGSWQSEPTCTLRRRLAEIASSMSAAERQKIYLRSSERKFRFISNSTVLKLAPPQAESR